MLEEKIEELTKAVKALTAQLQKGGGAAPAAASPGPGRPATTYTADQVKAAVVNVKDAVGTDAAKTIIKDAGAKDLADLLTKKGKFNGVMAACEAALEPSGEEEAAAEDDGGL